MPLNSTGLTKSLLKIFQAQPPSAAQAADKLATAYDIYARQALAGPASPTILPSARLQLKAQLLLALATPLAGAPPVIASAWATGVTLYWTVPPVLFAGPGVAGPVTAFPGQTILIPALTVIFANVLNTPPQAAKGVASALDTATRTVIVTLSPPGTPTPLS